MRALPFEPTDGLDVLARRAGSTSTRRRAGCSSRSSASSRRARRAAAARFEQRKARSPPRGCSTPRASGRCRCCRAPSASSTALTGAAIHDILTMLRAALRRRGASWCGRCACRATGAAADIAAALADLNRDGRRRRDHRRPRRRLARGSVGVQRGGRRARHRALAGRRWCRRSATRSTSRSPIWSPTCAPPTPTAAAARGGARARASCGRGRAAARRRLERRWSHRVERMRGRLAAADVVLAARAAWSPSASCACDGRVRRAREAMRSRRRAPLRGSASWRRGSAASVPRPRRDRAALDRLEQRRLAAWQSRLARHGTTCAASAARIQALSPLAVLGARLRHRATRRRRGGARRRRDAAGDRLELRLRARRRARRGAETLPDASSPPVRAAADPRRRHERAAQGTAQSFEEGMAALETLVRAARGRQRCRSRSRSRRSSAGVALVRVLSERLDEVEQRVEVLLRDADGVAAHARRRRRRASEPAGLERYLAAHRRTVERALRALLSARPGRPRAARRAMRYSLLGRASGCARSSRSPPARRSAGRGGAAACRSPARSR